MLPDGSSTAYAVYGGIRGKYLDLHGPEGVLGYPLSDERDAIPSSYGTHGRVNDFQNDGNIHWHRDGQRAGYAYETHGEIGKKYRQMGGTGSILGFPITDVMPLSNGAVSYFEGGRIYSSARGTYELHGPIVEKYDLTADLGWPLSDVMPAISSMGTRGFLALFENGSVYTSPRGTFAMIGRIHEEYIQRGDARGSLGFPMAEPIQHGLSTASGKPIHYSLVLCENGVLVYHEDGPQQGHAYVIEGHVFAKYREMNGHQSALGLPVSDVQTGLSTQGVRADFGTFENGVIVYHIDGPKSGQAFIGEGTIWRKWAENGGPETLGWPVKDGNEHVTSRPTGVHALRADFERGYLYQHLDGPQAGQVFVVGPHREIVPEAQTQETDPNPAVGGTKIAVEYRQWGLEQGGCGLPVGSEFLGRDESGTLWRAQAFERAQFQWKREDEERAVVEKTVIPISGDQRPDPDTTVEIATNRSRTEPGSPVFVNTTSVRFNLKAWRGTGWRDEAKTDPIYKPESEATFAYDLEEPDGEKVTGETMQESVEFQDLPDGQYTFRVACRIPDVGGIIMDPTPSVCHFVVKTAPPEVPDVIEVQTLPEGIFIMWEATSTSPHLLGYNVYRKQGEQGPSFRLNEVPIIEPQYLDKTAVEGEIYSYQVSALDRAGNESNKSRAVLAAIPVAFNVTFPSGLSMITVPLLPVDANPTKVFDVPATQLKLAKWEPQEQKYYFYTPTDPHELVANLEMGEGYWIKLDSPSLLRLQGDVAEESEWQIYHLRAGWNMWGSSFTEPINWDIDRIKIRNDEGMILSLREAQLEGWVEDYAWGYDPLQGYVLVYDTTIPDALHTVDPWRGYWMKAAINCDLLLPPLTEFSSASLLPRRGNPAKDNWQSQLVASADGVQDADNYFGVISQTTRQQGIQIEIPPATPAGPRPVELSFLDAQGRKLAVDLRRPIVSRTVWQFEVRTALPEAEVVIAWPNWSKMPGQVRPILVDEETGRRQSMRTTSHYKFRSGPQGAVRRFRLEIDPQANQPLVITQFTATGTRGGAVSFSYALSREANVEITVTTLRGRSVRTVRPGPRSRAGLNTLLWDGKDAEGRPLPNGVYLGVLRAVTEEGEETEAVRTVRVGEW